MTTHLAFLFVLPAGFVPIALLLGWMPKGFWQSALLIIVILLAAFGSYFLLGELESIIRAKSL